MTTEEKFNAAVNVIRSLPKNGSYQPSNELMLRFYAYFKQATQGPCSGSRPAFWDVVGRAKYDAWKKLGEMKKTDAMAKYVSELHEIVETMSYSDKVANFLEAPTDELSSLSMNDLELIAGDVMERVRSQPNSPFASREASPTRLGSSLNGTPSISPSIPIGDDTDHSDDEYIDTIENPEPRRYVPNGVPYGDGLSNGFVPHISRTRTKSQTNLDISQEVSKAVQSLKVDIDRLSNRVNSLENKNTQSAYQKRKGMFGNMSPQLISFMIVWPFFATFIMNRYFVNRK
ncbi:unnamed protein product [Brassicogethes aeneus]|uniref:ACB domain-containing protein n=1 Tax=Brassicogethes aeneus TaxID=1431903 RepID=A0A9P0AWN9_BRAAE|nr:unnamed protein product [Brassicogethes aeneus]